MKRRQLRYRYLHVGIAWESAVIRDCLRCGALELPWKARRECLPENKPSPASDVGVPLYLPRHRRRPTSRHVRFHGNTRNVLPTHLMPPRWELQRNVHRTGLLRGLHLHHGALRLDGRRHSQRELLDGRRTDASDRICLASPVRGSHTIKISDRGRDAVLRWQL